MYSPHSDLYKMLHTPEFILFRVDINGKEYLGRPCTITVDHPYGETTNQKGVFRTFDSEQSFLSGNVSEEIQVTSTTIKGIEAIDSVDRTPLNNILAACYETSQIPERPDIGIVRRNITPVLERLLAALSDYETLHHLAHYEVAFDDIEELINECKLCPTDLSENGRASIVRNLKKKISVNVSNLIEFSS